MHYRALYLWMVIIFYIRLLRFWYFYLKIFNTVAEGESLTLGNVQINPKSLDCAYFAVSILHWAVSSSWAHALMKEAFEPRTIILLLELPPKSIINPYQIRFWPPLILTAFRISMGHKFMSRIIMLHLGLLDHLELLLSYPWGRRRINVPRKLELFFAFYENVQW